MKRSTTLALIILVLVVNIFISYLFATGKENSNFMKRVNLNDNVTLNRQTSITQAVQMIEPAVVSVNVLKTEIVRSNPFYDDPFFGGFFGGAPMKREVQSLGSGVIYSEDGYIITNAHVVEGATKIKVILTDGRELDAKLLGIDNLQDIAVIKVDDKKLPIAKIGVSSDLIIGEWVIAVGNPYAFLIKDSKPSVSVGVISAVDRNFTQKQDGKLYKKMIQTDAAINPGNSGGPLVNINGEVIGINSFIFSENGGSVGIGFAIPIDKAKKIAQDIIKYGKVRQAFFGFMVQDLNQMIANYLNINTKEGVIVTVVNENSGAEKAGLKRSDVILKINNNPIKNAQDAEMAVGDVAPGDEVKVQVKRGDKEVEIVFVAEEYKK